MLLEWVLRYVPLTGSNDRFSIYEYDKRGVGIPCMICNIRVL
jgi:hypothetical protein